MARDGWKPVVLMFATSNKNGQPVTTVDVVLVVP